MVATERNPTGPSQATIKRLFACSGNRCAFPQCGEVLVQGSTVLGEICHIKAASPRGPRYEPQQTAAERHGYDNLVLLCEKHHTMIDADEKTYTVDCLSRMRGDHESQAGKLDDDFAKRAALLLLGQPVISANQSGGITAHTVINIHAPSGPSQTNQKLRQHTLILDIENTTAARFRNPGHQHSGNIALLFYNLRILNSLDENVTVRKVILHYDLNGKHFSTDSHILLTGAVPSSDKKENIDSIILRVGPANIIIQNWENLRMQIDQNKLLLPGGVLAGSALFVLEFKDANDLANIQDCTMSIIDYSGNETKKEIRLENKWIEQAKRQIVEDRRFVVDPSGRIAYSN